MEVRRPLNLRAVIIAGRIRITEITTAIKVSVVTRITLIAERTFVASLALIFAQTVVSATNLIALDKSVRLC